VSRRPSENVWTSRPGFESATAPHPIWVGDLEIAVPCLLLRRTFVLGVEQTHFDRLRWLLRVDDDRFARPNVHQLIFDLLFRFQ
jgi:hypothetical protein